MKISYDPYVDAINMVFRKGKVAKTLEIASEVNLDLNSRSRPLYLEIIGTKEKLGKVGAEEISMKNLIFEKNKNKSMAFA